MRINNIVNIINNFLIELTPDNFFVKFDLTPQELSDYFNDEAFSYRGNIVCSKYYNPKDEKIKNFNIIFGNFLTSINLDDVKNYQVHKSLTEMRDILNTLSDEDIIRYYKMGILAKLKINYMIVNNYHSHQNFMDNFLTPYINNLTSHQKIAYYSNNKYSTTAPVFCKHNNWNSSQVSIVAAIKQLYGWAFDLPKFLTKIPEISYLIPNKKYFHATFPSTKGVLDFSIDTYMSVGTPSALMPNKTMSRHINDISSVNVLFVDIDDEEHANDDNFKFNLAQTIVKNSPNIPINFNISTRGIHLFTFINLMNVNDTMRTWEKFVHYVSLYSPNIDTAIIQPNRLMSVPYTLKSADDSNSNIFFALPNFYTPLTLDSSSRIDNRYNDVKNNLLSMTTLKIFNTFKHTQHLFPPQIKKQITEAIFSNNPTLASTLIDSYNYLDAENCTTIYATNETTNATNIHNNDNEYYKTNKIKQYKSIPIHTQAGFKANNSKEIIVPCINTANIDYSKTPAELDINTLLGEALPEHIINTLVPENKRERMKTQKIKPFIVTIKHPERVDNHPSFAISTKYVSKYNRREIVFFDYAQGSYSDSHSLPEIVASINNISWIEAVTAIAHKMNIVVKNKKSVDKYHFYQLLTYFYELYTSDVKNNNNMSFEIFKYICMQIFNIYQKLLKKKATIPEFKNNKDGFVMMCDEYINNYLYVNVAKNKYSVPTEVYKWIIKHNKNKRHHYIMNILHILQDANIIVTKCESKYPLAHLLRASIKLHAEKNCTMVKFVNINNRKLLISLLRLQIANVEHRKTYKKSLNLYCNQRNKAYVKNLLITANTLLLLNKVYYEKLIDKWTEAMELINDDKEFTKDFVDVKNEIINIINEIHDDFNTMLLNFILDLIDSLVDLNNEEEAC